MTRLAPTRHLTGGTDMPVIGAGTWPLDDREVERMALTAFEIGFRLIDTAENYRNEAGVGNAVRASGLPREDLFVTTKFNREWHGNALKGVDGNLQRLGLDYIDLLLIHWPNPDQDLYVTAWEGLIQARDRGLVKAIGTSNFTPVHLQRVIDATGVAPEVNQIQCNPYADRGEERAFHDAHGIVTESWAPLAGKGLVDDPVVVDTASTVDATPSQVVLAWHLQQGLVPIPKSGNPDRLRENFAALDVTLPPEDIARLTSLANPDYRLSDPDSFGH